MSEKVSIIIPSRLEPYLQKTIDDIFVKATGDFEVIVILDGYEELIESRKNLTIIYQKEALGTRKSMNRAIKIASGKYIFKTDAHCMFSEGFDEILKKDHENDSVVTLSRYSLKPEEWEKGYGPILYEFIEFPFGPKGVGGLTPKKWIGPNGKDENTKVNYFWMENKRASFPVDEIMTCNGACWFLTKDFYNSLGGMDEELWSFHIDAVELGFKAWLSGGKMLINKNAWHAHWWKPSDKRTVPLKWDIMRSVAAYSTWYWMYDQWPKQVRTFEWFVEKFWPIPSWPENWREYRDKLKKPSLMQGEP